MDSSIRGSSLSAGGLELWNGSPADSKREEDSGQQVEDKSLQKNKTPRRIIYFTSGESMEEYSTEEEEDPAEDGRELLLDTAKLSWGSYFRFWTLRIATTTFFTCEFLGGKLATLFGLNEPKYQYAIDEYYRTQVLTMVPSLQYGRRNLSVSLLNGGSESDEDGEVMEGVAAAPNEEQHLEMQSLGYGSILHEDMPAFSQKDAVENVDELGKEGALPDPKYTPVTGK